MVVAKREANRRSRAAIAALKPIAEMFLDFGLTSPEAEGLFRAVFVHAARKRVTQGLKPGQSPSDVRIALMTGIHRNFVRKILLVPPAIPESRTRRGASVARLVAAWRTDPRYIDASGAPLDIAEGEDEPSFKSLVRQYLPGVTPAVALSELRRANRVQLMSNHRLRLQGHTST